MFTSSGGAFVRNVLALTMVSLAVTLGFAATAGAQTYPPGGCELAVSSSIVQAGGTTTIATNGNCATGGFLPGSTVTFTLFSTPVTLGTTIAQANGGVSAKVTIPAAATPGTHTIEASGPAASGGTLTLQTTVVVGALGSLPLTGSSSIGQELGIGVVALVAGGALIGAARRRARERELVRS